ncbi:MAG: acyl-CoA dehydrogenase [Paraburkholderia sp.]|nr:MAG: acyl-CoA dehydrogenase [Paraburkholderia sp.]
MDFAYTERQLRQSRCYRDLGLRHARAGNGDSDGFDWHAWHAVTEAGIWRLPLLTRDPFEFIAAFEGLTGAMRSIGFAMAVANQATLIDAIQSLGTAEQQAALLPRLVGGEPGATAISESGTGSEIRALQTRLSDDGHGLRLDGQKYNISLAPHASLMLVAARYEADAKVQTAMVLIDGAMAGVTRSPPRVTLGVRDLPIGELHFDAVRVDAAHLLGSPRDGLHALMRIASMNRAYFALMCANVVEPFLADALRHAAARRILGVAIDTHQHVQRRLVDVRMRAQRSRWMALASLDELVKDRTQAVESCSIAKIVAAQDLTQSALDLLAIHGSDGYRSGALSTFVADALAMISAGGTEEMHRKNVFAQMQRNREPGHARVTQDARPGAVGVEAADRRALDRPSQAAASAGVA